MFASRDFNWDMDKVFEEVANSGNLDQLGQQFQPWSSLQTSIISGENMHSDLSNYPNASYQSLFSHTSPTHKIVLHHMYLEPAATVLSLPEGPESVNALLIVYRKLLASQMGFCSALDPRDFCVCILILTQWIEIIFIVFFLRDGGVECF